MGHIWTPLGLPLMFSAEDICSTNNVGFLGWPQPSKAPEDVLQDGHISTHCDPHEFSKTRSLNTSWRSLDLRLRSKPPRRMFRMSWIFVFF